MTEEHHLAERDEYIGRAASNNREPLANATALARGSLARGSRLNGFV
jgi:hypothetical protein